MQPSQESRHCANASMSYFVECDAMTISDYRVILSILLSYGPNYCVMIWHAGFHGIVIDRWYHVSQVWKQCDNDHDKVYNGPLRHFFITSWIPRKLVIPSHFIPWKNSFSDISRKYILPNMFRVVNRGAVNHPNHIW